jgi:Cd2+/Zn2+-exporting ATPase
VFDKTGTLTEGTFEVTQVFLNETTTTMEQLLYASALAESHSNHPIAKSIVTYANQTFDTASIISTEEVSGHGVKVSTNIGLIWAGNKKLMREAAIDYPDVPSVHTLVYVALEGRYLGAFEIRDRIKPDAKMTIDYLQANGLNVLMLTGDRQSAAYAVADELGFKNVHSELLPAQKYAVVKKLLDSGRKVAFVGDGINDAPVLAGATVGISMGAIGSDAAIEASDIVLMTDEPSKIVQALKISRKTKQIVTQNIVFALGTKLIIMALGTVGLSSMWMAIFADVGVSLIAVLNATRALHYDSQIR